MLEIFIYKKDIAQARSLFDNGMGFRYQVDFYLKSEPKQPKGSFYKSMIFLQQHSMGTIFLSLNKNSGLSFTQVVGQKQWPATGGTGSFGNCVGGYMERTGISKTKYEYNVHVCHTC